MSDIPLKIEKAPWRVEIGRNGMGRVSHVRVLASEPRHVYVATMQAETFQDRAGNVHLKPGAIPKMTETHDIQPAVVCHCGMAEAPVVVCDCGVSYVGLSGETLLAHGDLIAAAPELYRLLGLAGGIIEFILLTVTMPPDRTEAFYKLDAEIKAALSQARGESVKA